MKGTVEYRGKPMDRGTVLFAALGSRDVASAPIREGGTFVVSLLSGTYGAAVRCLADEKPTDNLNQPPAGKNLVPEKYTDTATSGLTVTVTRGMPAVRLELSP